MSFEFCRFVFITDKLRITRFDACIVESVTAVSDLFPAQLHADVTMESIKPVMSQYAV